MLASSFNPGAREAGKRRDRRCLGRSSRITRLDKTLSETAAGRPMSQGQIQYLRPKLSWMLRVGWGSRTPKTSHPRRVASCSRKWKLKFMRCKLPHHHRIVGHRSRVEAKHSDHHHVHNPVTVSTNTPRSAGDNLPSSRRRKCSQIHPETK